MEHIFEFVAAARAELLGSLALVSKFGHACAMSSSVARRLKMSTHKRFFRMQEEEGWAEASSQLVVHLRQAVHHYPGIREIDLGHEYSPIHYVKN